MKERATLSLSDGIMSRDSSIQIIHSSVIVTLTNVVLHDDFLTVQYTRAKLHCGGFRTTLTETGRWERVYVGETERYIS